MNWEAIGAFGELVAAIAVVVTLVFLIQQLRQSTAALRQQSERASANAIHSWSLTMMTPDVAKTVSRGYIPSNEPLPAEALVTIEHFAMAFLIALQQDYFDWERGFQSDELWASRAGMVKGVFSSLQVRQWWNTIGSEYVVPEFKNIINEIISGAVESTGDYWKAFRENPETSRD